MYAVGLKWKTWMKDFRFGTLVYFPKGDLREVADRLREAYDPACARGCPAHITITQPFKEPPTEDQINQIEDMLSKFNSSSIQVGPFVTSPNKKLIWLDVNPKAEILAIRDHLHKTGLFHTDLPLTKGFIPHMTISESQLEPEVVTSIIGQLNEKYSPWSILFDSVTWSIPDEESVFLESRRFKLKG